MFHSFFRSLARPCYQSLFSRAFSLPCGHPERQCELFDRFPFFFFFFWTFTRSGSLSEIMWSENFVRLVFEDGFYYFIFIIMMIKTSNSSHQSWQMVSQWSLSECKSPRVSRTFLSILDILNNAVSWMVSTRPLISKTPSPCTYPFVTILRAPITICITVTFMFHSFFNFLASSRYISFFLLSFSFTLWSAETPKSKFLQVLFCFLLIITRSGRLAEIWWSVSISKSQWSLCVSFSRTVYGLCIYQLFGRSNLNLLYKIQWITLPTQSCLVLYSFWDTLLHSLTMRLIVSSLSPPNLAALLHLIFSCFDKIGT